MTVEMLDKLAKSIPVGVTLGTVKQQGMTVTLSGSSQSNARVSAYLQELEKSDLFLKPELTIVKSATPPAFPTEPYNFSLKVNLRPPITEEDEGYEDEGYDDEGSAP